MKIMFTKICKKLRLVYTKFNYQPVTHFPLADMIEEYGIQKDSIKTCIKTCKLISFAKTGH